MRLTLYPSPSSSTVKLPHGRLSYRGELSGTLACIFQHLLVCPNILFHHAVAAEVLLHMSPGMTAVQSGDSFQSIDRIIYRTHDESSGTVSDNLRNRPASPGDHRSATCH